MELSCRNERDNTGIFQGTQPQESEVAQVLDFLPFEAVKLFWSFPLSGGALRLKMALQEFERRFALTSVGIA